MFEQVINTISSFAWKFGSAFAFGFASINAHAAGVGATIPVLGYFTNLWYLRKANIRAEKANMVDHPHLGTPYHGR